MHLLSLILCVVSATILSLLILLYQIGCCTIQAFSWIGLVSELVLSLRMHLSSLGILLKLGWSIFYKLLQRWGSHSLRFYSSLVLSFWVWRSCVLITYSIRPCNFHIGDISSHLVTTITHSWSTLRLIIISTSLLLFLLLISCISGLWLISTACFR